MQCPATCLMTEFSKRVSDHLYRATNRRMGAHGTVVFEDAECQLSLSCRRRFNKLAGLLLLIVPPRKLNN